MLSLSGINQAKISFGVQTLIVGAGIAMVALFARPRWLPAAADRHEFIAEEKARRRPRLLWILGFFRFCGALSEGAAGDWRGILTRDTFHASHFVSTIPYIAFSATMVIGLAVGFIVVPPTLGFVADLIQLRWAMFIPAVLVAFPTASARFAKTD